jgi:glycerophosphoryl diester phosphodiesterase
MIKVAHRGYINGNHPENSRSALLKAIELDYDMIEIDLRETKDKQIILHHDEDLMRLFKVDIKVKNLTLNQLKELKFSNYVDLMLSFEDALWHFLFNH